MDTPLSFLLSSLRSLWQKPSAPPPLPEDWEAELSRTDWNRRDVLVGSLRSRQQLDICLKHRFYHIPVVQLTEDDLPIRYVAIYQSRTLFGEKGGIYYYGKVTACTRVRRWEIRELPRDSEERYYRFDVESWETLPAPIVPKETGFAYLLTNFFLLKNSREVPELTFMSEREFRFCQALRRALEAKHPKAFLFEGSRITFEKKTIRIYRSGKLMEVEATCFEKIPSASQPVEFGK